MNQTRRIILVAAAALLALPATAWAQRPSNTVETRSAALYLDRARNNPNPDERRALYEQALAVLEDGIEKHPRNPRVFFMAGQALVHLDDYEGAASMFSRAEALYPQYEEVRTERENAWIRSYNAGVTSLQQNRPDEAIELLQKANLIFDRRPEAWLNLGSVYHRTDRTEDAIEAYRSALATLRGPGRQGLPPAQLANWREWEEIAAFNLAQMLATTGRDDEAVQAYRDLLERDPDNVTAQVNLAVVMSRMGQASEAAALYQELLARPDLGEGDYGTIGTGLYRAERYVEAAHAFRELARLNPQSRDAYYNLTQALYLTSTQLEEQYKAASGADRDRLRSELQALYEEMASMAAKVREFDPLNDNILRLEAQAHRGIADLHSGAESDAARRRALAALEKGQELTFVVEDIQMHDDNGEVRLTGRVRNERAAAGQPLRFRLSVLSAAGDVVATEEVTVQAPAPEQRAAFEVRMRPNQGQGVAGWKVEAVGD